VPLEDGRTRVVIENVTPRVNDGAFPIKRVVGDAVMVEADVFADGHDAISCALLYKKEGAAEWIEVPMEPLINDRWRASFTVQELGRYLYTVTGWVDHYKSWSHALEKRVQANQDITVDLIIGADMIADIVEAIPIGMFRLGTRLYSEASLADRLAPVHNLIVSNVVGSPIPLYMAGARVDAMYPFGPLMEGTGLNITVISHDGNMNIGVIACPDLVPNVAELLDAMLEGVDVLLEAARSSA